MTEEEVSFITTTLYGAMDSLTDLVRYLNGSAGYAKRQTRDHIKQLEEIEGVLHRTIHQMQKMESEEEK